MTERESVRRYKQSERWRRMFSGKERKRRVNTERGERGTSGKKWVKGGND